MNTQSDGRNALTPGQLLRHLREFKGWDQRELADRAGVSVRAVGQYERDQISNPTTTTLLPLAREIGGTEGVELLHAWGFHDDAAALAKRTTSLEAERRRDTLETLFRRVIEELGLAAQADDE